MEENKISIRKLKRSLTEPCSDRQREFIRYHIRQGRKVRFFQISIFVLLIAAW